MDERDFELAEKIFQTIKVNKGGFPDVILKQEILEKENWGDPNELKRLNRLYEILHKNDIIEKVSKNSGYTIYPGSNSQLFDSVKEYFQELDKKQKEIKEEIELNKQKVLLEIRYLKVQIWANEKWYIIAGGSALLGVAITKIIDYIPKN